MAKKIRHPRRTANRQTICELHKELHDMIFEYIPDPDIRALALKKAETVYDMGKRMDRKLKEYAYCIAKKEWRDWEYVNPYRGILGFYRRARKVGLHVPDPFRTEANDMKNGKLRDPHDGIIPPETIYPSEYAKWKKLTKRSSSQTT